MFKRQKSLRLFIVGIALIAITGLTLASAWSGLISSGRTSAQTENKADYITPPEKPQPKKAEKSVPPSDNPDTGNLISATTYVFTNSTGNALEDMSSGTTLLLTADGDDTISSIAPIGFEFWFDGVRQTVFSVNANGLMKLNPTQVTSAFTNDLATATNAPQIAPYWDDQWIGNNGKVHYKVIGAAPNRKLVVEWQNEQIPRVATATAGAGTYQAWLYESTGKIEFVYGNGIALNSTNSGYSVGFGSSATQFASVTTATPTVAYGTANNANTNAITAGTKYTFTPTVPADPSALTFTSVGLNAMTLNWADNATNELGYAIYRSFDGVNYEFITQAAANSTSSLQSGLASNTNYFWKVYAVTEGTLSNALSGSQATTTGTVSGTRTIGPTGTYLTIGAAVTDMNTNGLAGNVILELQSTYLSAVETFPLTINTVGSPSNTITLRPATGATGLTITTAATTTLSLNAAAFWTFDGRAGGAGASQLTVAGTATSTIPISLFNDSRNNLLEYLTVTGSATATTNGDIVFSGTNGPIGNSFNTIDNCDIKDGATTPTNGIYSLGAAAAPNANNTISNNLIHEYFSAGSVSNGILLSSAAGNLGNLRWTISNNKFFQTPTRTYTTGNIHTAIGIGTTSTGATSTGFGYTITGNTIGFANAGGTGTYTMAGTIATRFIGISLNAGAEPSSVQNNTITNFSIASSSGATTANGVFTGVHVFQGNANIGTTTGNTVGGTGTGQISTTVTTSLGLTNGISVAGSTTVSLVAAVNISNNTIGGITANGSSAAVGASLNGIFVSQGQPTVSNNVVGSNTTALSMNSLPAGTTSTLVNGILVTAAFAPVTITGNLVANFNATGTGTAAVGRGITNASAGLGTVTGNTIHDIASTSTNTTVAGGGTAVQGILQTGATTLGATVSGNTIYTLSATNTGAVQTNVAGIGSSNPTNGVTTKNKIYDLRNASTMAVATTPPTVSGILIRAALGTSGTFTNNMISLGTAQTTNTEFIGIWNSFVTNTLNVHYNSVHIAGTATTGALPSFGFLRGDNTATSAITTVVDIKNNIFNNTRTGGTGKHYAIGNVNTVPATGWAAGASNNNVLNSANASTVGIWGLATDETFANWKIASGSDGASLSGVSVIFVDPTNGDLHLNFGVTPTALESGGVAVATTTVDFDNQARPGPAGSVNGGALAPDIGADEFDGVPLDITAPSIAYTPFANTTFTANRTLSVTIIDAGGVATGGNAPRIYFRKNAGVYVSNACTLSSGTVNNGTWNCIIDYSLVGGATTGDVIDYFVIAQDVSGNIGSNPGGVVATNVNTVSTPPTPNTYTIIGGFPATVTVGTGGTYTSLTNAGGLFQAMNAGVFTNNVTVNITSDLSGESGTFALNPLTEEPTGSNFTVLIKPSGAVRTITGTAAAVSIIKLNGADRITIDGSLSGGTDRSLNITGLNIAASTTVVWVASNGADGAQNNTIKNTVITGGSDQSTGVAFTFCIISSSSAAILTGATDNDNDTYQNNLVQKASVGIASLAASTANLNQNTAITGNTVGPATFGTNEIGTAGILLLGENLANVTGNEVQSVGDLAITGGGSGRDRVGIVVGGPGASWSSTTAGTTAFVTNSNISRNLIHGIAEQATFSAVGIVLNDVNGGLATNNTVANNMIYNVIANGTSPDQGAGIGITNGNGDKVVYNSIYLTGDLDPGAATSADRGTFGITIPIAGAVNLDLRDNISVIDVNSNTGTLLNSAINIPAGYAWGTGGSNFNDWYAPAGNPQSRVGTVGNTPSGNFHPTLSAWQTATGQDTNSISADPKFVSGTDLHLLTSPTISPAVGAGAPVAGVSNDFDNDPRPASNPDIGADEVVMAVGGSIPAGTYYNVQAGTNNTLGGNVTVTGNLTLTGTVTTGANTLTIGCGATVTGAGGYNYVVGNVKKNFCATGSFTFPVGTTPDNSLGVAPAEYSPMTANITTLNVNPSSLTVSVTDAFLPGIIQSSAVSRYWTVDETGDLVADMTFQYIDPLDVNGNEANYKVFRRSGGFTTEIVPNSNNPAANTATVFNVSNFSDWGIGASVPLAASVNVGGRVTTFDGVTGLPRVRVTINGSTLTEPRTITTTPFGYYQFEDLPVGTYVLTVESKQYIFTVPTRVVTAEDNITGEDFIANP